MFDFSRNSSFKWFEHKADELSSKDTLDSLSEMNKVTQASFPATSAQRSELSSSCQDESHKLDRMSDDSSDVKSTSSHEEIYDQVVMDLFSKVRSLDKITTEVDFIVESHKHDTRIIEQGKKRRQRLTKEQESILEHEFQKNMDWCTKVQAKLAKRLGMRVSKVYKWQWDRKKRFLSEAT
jgi:hypothetical protein